MILGHLAHTFLLVVNFIFMDANLDALVRELDNRDFGAREEATRKLASLIDSNSAALEQLARGPLTVEQRLRLDALLAQRGIYSQQDLERLDLVFNKGSTQDILAAFDHFGPLMVSRGGSLLEGIPDLGKLDVDMTTRDFVITANFSAPKGMLSPFWFDERNLKGRWKCELDMPIAQWDEHQPPQKMARKFNTQIGEGMISSNRHRIKRGVNRVSGVGAILGSISLQAWNIPGTYILDAACNSEANYTPIFDNENKQVVQLRTVSCSAESHALIKIDPFVEIQAGRRGLNLAPKKRQINGKDVSYGLELTVSCDSAVAGSKTRIRIRVQYQNYENIKLLCPDIKDGKFLCSYFRKIGSNSTWVKKLDNRHQAVLNISTHPEKFIQLKPAEFMDRELTISCPSEPGMYQLIISYGYFGNNPFAHYMQLFGNKVVAKNKVYVPQGVYFSSIATVNVLNLPEKH